MTEPHPPTPQRFTFTGRRRSFAFAVRGIRLIISTQHNAWLHAAISLVVIAAGFLFHLGRWEWCAAVLSMATVWSAEAMNTGLEFLCDVASPEFHPLVEKAKDVAAGAVLLSAIGAAAVGALLFMPHVVAMLHR